MAINFLKLTVDMCYRYIKQSVKYNSLSRIVTKFIITNFDYPISSIGMNLEKIVKYLKHPRMIHRAL
jgi:hypothetical protein